MKYIYTATSAPVAEPPTVLMPEMIAALPGSLRHQFVEALVSLDSHTINDAIGQTAHADANLAAALTRLVADFDYMTILDAIENASADAPQMH